MKEIAKATLDQDDADPLDLLAELEVQRVLLAVMIDQLQPGAAPGLDLGSAGPRSDPGASPPVISYELPGNKATQAIREAMEYRPNKERKKIEKEESQKTITVGGGGVAQNGIERIPVDGVLAEFSSLEDQTEIKSDKSVINLDVLEQIQKQLDGIVTTVTRIIAQRNQTAMTKAEVGWLLMVMKEGMDKFVPKENQEAYIRWMMENIPGHRRVEETEGEAL
jgi:hypothetical protein